MQWTVRLDIFSRVVDFCQWFCSLFPEYLPGMTWIYRRSLFVSFQKLDIELIVVPNVLKLKRNLSVVSLYNIPAIGDEYSLKVNINMNNRVGVRNEECTVDCKGYFLYSYRSQRRY